MRGGGSEHEERGEVVETMEETMGKVVLEESESSLEVDQGEGSK
jgi:hypothetical protein